jgi:metal-dependent HD superfamily phosphatase/phosphodiesterase
VSHFIAKDSLEYLAVSSVEVGYDKYRLVGIEVSPEKILYSVGIFRVEQFICDNLSWYGIQ